MPVKVDILSKKQLRLIDWPYIPRYSNVLAIIADGSIRTGKSMWMSLGFILWSMDQFDETNFGMAGHTIESLHRNVISPLIKMIKSMDYNVKFVKNENKITITYGNHTNYYYLFGGQNKASQDLVQGITVAGFYFDEVTIQDEAFVTQATLRSVSYKGRRKNWFNCNPKGPYHWFKVKWIDQLKKHKAIRVKFKMEDNPIMDKATIDDLKNQYSGVFRKRYIDGDWVMASGLVYSNFDAKTMVKNAPPIDECTDFYISSDYGAQNPTVFELWGKYEEHWYMLKCYYYDGRHAMHNKSDQEYADDLDDFLGNMMRKVPIILDPSAKSFDIELEQRGYEVIPADNNVIAGIRQTQTAMNSGLFYFTQNLPDVFREINSYIWDSKAAEKGVDKVVKQHDHAMDAMRYFIKFIMDKKEDEQNSGMQVFDRY